MTKKLKYIVVSFVALLFIWQLAAMFTSVNAALFPTPAKVGKAFIELFSTGLTGSSSNATLLGHILVSLKRFAIGYLLAVLLGIFFGLILGWFPTAFAYVNPIIQLIRPIAPVAWMPFIVLFAGIGDVPAILIIFLAGFFIVLLSTASAVRGIDSIYLRVAQNFGISKARTLTHIVFPAIFPQIAASLHLALGTSWIFLVSGEMVGAQSGLGYLIMDAKNCIRPDALLATMITIGAIGLLLDTLIGIFEVQIATRWGIGAAGKVERAKS